MKNYLLHLDQPAVSWDNGTPLGCGRMGMMLMGHPAEECIYLNEDSIWAGGEPEMCTIDFKAMVAESRRLFLEGRDADVEALVNAHGEAPYRKVQSYEYAGRLRVVLPDLDGVAVTDYRRDLDLVRGVATVSYTAHDVFYRRDAFSSHPAGVQVVRFTADKPVTMRVIYERENLDEWIDTPYGFTAVGHTATGNHRFAVSVRVQTNGHIQVSEGGMTVTKADELVLLISIASTFRHADVVEAAVAPLRVLSDYRHLYDEHIADFSAIMSRTDIDFTPSAEQNLSTLAVPMRLERLKSDPTATDPALLSLYLTFGKYLLVSSSREDSLPANLQGVWSEGLVSPWGADYHVNINFQMNYWHAEAAGLSESLASMFAYMNHQLLPGARRTAREDYGARGAVVHHLSDIYGFAGAADAAYYGLWPAGGAWLCYHLWEHYLYTEDEAFLRDTAYPFIRDCALFFFDYLFEDGSGRLLSGPSMSPENSFFVNTAGGERRVCTTTMSPTMDNEIIGGLLRFYAEIERILGIHPADGLTADRMADRLPPLSVGKHGQLMEWIRDYDEYEPGHRHISHAFGLYPGALITRETPELLNALKITFARRLAYGGGHSGWSRAWFVNFYARLHDGENAYANLRTLLTHSTLPNLLDNHPPFQIDGNFGGAAGIQEMLLQSHEGFLSVLPALPAELPHGLFTALRARGGYEVDAAWQDGRLIMLTLRARHDRPVEVETPDPDGTCYADADGVSHTVRNGRLTIPARITLTRIFP